MVVIGQGGCIRAKWFVGAKSVVFGQRGFIREKVVLFGQKYFYLGKRLCILANVIVLV